MIARFGQYAVAAVLVGLAVPSLIATAQETSEKPIGRDNDARLEEVLRSYYESNGGHERLLDLQSVRLKAELILPGGRQGELTHVRQRPNRILSTWESADGARITTGSDGQRAWEIVERADGLRKARMLDETPENAFESLLVEPEITGADLELLPSERLNGMECYVIEASLPNGSSKIYWLDQEGYREQKIVEMEGGEVQRTIELSEHTRHDGIWFPGIQRQTEDGMTIVLNLQEVELNPGILPVVFDLPRGLADQAAR